MFQQIVFKTLFKSLRVGGNETGINQGTFFGAKSLDSFYHGNFNVSHLCNFGDIFTCGTQVL